MRAVLSDTGWHPIDAVLRAGIGHVPPQRAAAEYRTQVVARRRGTGTARVTALHEQIRAGRFTLCRRVLLGWARYHLIEIDPPGRNAPHKRVRLAHPAGQHRSNGRTTPPRTPQI